MTTDVSHRTLAVNGIRMHIAEAGEGPLVVLCHGWPELWSTWRHQLRALAAAGFHAVAPDMRGYGQTDAPDDIGAYTIFHLVGDVVALVRALEERHAYIVGHDWGSNVAWQAAMMRPDIFTAVVATSVPIRRRSAAPPLQTLRAANMADFYWCYFQEPGVAEAELERDPEDTLRRLMHSGSGDAPTSSRLQVPAGSGFLTAMTRPESLPPWFSQADLDFLVSEYRRTGFRGGLNWYRNLDKNWELSAAYQGATIAQPSLFIAGTRDSVIRGRLGEAALKHLEEIATGLRRKVLIEGAGHWITEERPEEVNAELISFFKTL